METFGFYDQAIQGYFNLQPSVVKGPANTDTQLQKRYLYTKIASTLKFTLPKDWDVNYFRFYLFQLGSIGVIYTEEFGWVCQPYSVTQLNIYRNPKVIEVYNEMIKNKKTGIIGLNAGIVHIMDDYFGLDDIVTKYAVKLSQIDKAIDINLMNCNDAKLFEAESKKQADEIKEAYDQASEGRPFVVLNKDVLKGKQITTLLPSVKNNYIVTDLLNARRAVVNQFLTEVGIKNANYEKKERLNSQEVNQNNDETQAVISIIYENIKKSFDVINSFSGLGLAVEYAYNYSDSPESEAMAWEE